MGFLKAVLMDGCNLWEMLCHRVIVCLKVFIKKINRLLELGLLSLKIECCVKGICCIIRRMTLFKSVTYVERSDIGMLEDE